MPQVAWLSVFGLTVQRCLSPVGLAGTGVLHASSIFALPLHSAFLSSLCCCIQFIAYVLTTFVLACALAVGAVAVSRRACPLHSMALVAFPARLSFTLPGAGQPFCPLSVLLLLPCELPNHQRGGGGASGREQDACIRAGLARLAGEEQKLPHSAAATILPYQAHGNIIKQSNTTMMPHACCQPWPHGQGAGDGEGNGERQ